MIPWLAVQYLGMKIICPVCELFLVEVSIVQGVGTFYCLRCASGDFDRDDWMHFVS
jgi:Zn-finger nucleic acid-binding protein